MAGLTDAWYQGSAWLHLLRPLSALFRLLSRVRRKQLTALQHPSAIPVIVVGNISVGGTGKTPVVIALADALESSGRRVGVISRGYGGTAKHYPLFVSTTTDVRKSGDEARLMRKYLRGPLVLDPQRSRALQALIAQSDCDVVISDDGLQHYRMGRDIEIVVVDAARGLGNGLCLPAGPLREPAQRLSEVDFVLINGQHPLQLPTMQTVPARFTLEPHAWINVRTGQQVSLSALALALGASDEQAPVAIDAIAGIGNPERFFETVRQLGFEVRARKFPDHHAYSKADLAFASQSVLLMTEKDAVKCQHFASDNWWYLSVKAALPATFLQAISKQLDGLDAARKAG